MQLSLSISRGQPSGFRLWPPGGWPNTYLTGGTKEAKLPAQAGRLAWKKYPHERLVLLLLPRLKKTPAEA